MNLILKMKSTVFERLNRRKEKQSTGPLAIRLLADGLLKLSKFSNKKKDKPTANDTQEEVAYQ